MDTITLRVMPVLEGARGLGYHALLLALSSTLAEEEALKSALGGLGLHCAVTETGGNSSGDFQAKSMRAVIGAALNAGLIEKTPAPSMRCCMQLKRPSAGCWSTRLPRQIWR